MWDEQLFIFFLFTSLDHNHHHHHSSLSTILFVFFAEMVCSDHPQTHTQIYIERKERKTYANCCMNCKAFEKLESIYSLQSCRDVKFHLIYFILFFCLTLHFFLSFNFFGGRVVIVVLHFSAHAIRFAMARVQQSQFWYISSFVSGKAI